jgi:hypothetical protein
MNTDTPQPNEPEFQNRLPDDPEICLANISELAQVIANAKDTLSSEIRNLEARTADKFRTIVESLPDGQRIKSGCQIIRFIPEAEKTDRFVLGLDFPYKRNVVYDATAKRRDRKIDHFFSELIKLFKGQKIGNLLINAPENSELRKELDFWITYYCPGINGDEDFFPRHFLIGRLEKIGHIFTIADSISSESNVRERIDEVLEADEA